jgi:hypothetical protein
MACDEYTVPDVNDLSKTCKMPECAARSFVMMNGDCG